MMSPQLSSLQLELLKLFALNPSEADLIFVRKVLAAYFATKSDIASFSDLEQWFEKSTVQVIPPVDMPYPPTVEEPLSTEYKNLITEQSKNALATAVAKEEPLILE